MSPGPEQSVMLSLLGGGFVAAFLHAALPTHWLPFTLVGRAQGWRASRVLLAVTAAGLAHIASTAVVGCLIVAAGLALEGIGLMAHARDLTHAGGEGSASHLTQRTTFGNTYRLRNGGLLSSLALVTALGMFQLDGVAGLAIWLATAALIIATAAIGRALFYVLVIPTTMPGAFFWRNKGFEEHARETGLANMPQVGVLPNAH